MAAGSVARVLIDSPLPQLDRLFDYGIPEHLARDAVPGVRVRVPLRSAGRVADGYLVEVADAGDYTGALSELDAVVSPARVLAPEVWQLARRVADRAAGSASDILRLAIPSRQVRVEKAYLADDSQAPLTVVSSPDLEYYDDALDDVDAGGRFAVDAVPRVRDVNGSSVGEWAVTLAALAARQVAAGRTAILAVPDYRDQEQLQHALAAVLPPESIVRLDARQSNAERYRSFLLCLGARPLAIIGNRSVLYAPAGRLGLIALWDDGDPLFVEPLAPYVHARDVALLRQEQQGCALVLIAHARSTEVERLVEVGWLTEVTPPPKLAPKIIPTVLQLGGERLAQQARIPPGAWQAARQALEHGPVLVQVARPGFAPGLACVGCGDTARCTRCEGPLRQGSGRSPASCAWCGALAVGWRCATCEGTRMRPVGVGATRTADELGRAFPGVRVILADGERQVLQVGAEPALVVATRGAEPIAAGGYRAVLLLDGERMLVRESLRVAEDCLRWWSNAAALAAEGAPVMLVGVGGAIASALATWRQADHARGELADRRRLRFPPAVRVASVTGTLETVQSAVEASGIELTDVLGPVDLGPGTVRTILRFDYADGARVAAALRAEVVKAATARRPKIAKGTSPAPRPTLRVRFDDIEPFLEPEGR